LGKDFFKKEKKAIKNIFKAIKSNDDDSSSKGDDDSSSGKKLGNGGITNSDILSKLEDLVVNGVLEADRQVAETAIADAIAAAGNPKKITKAEKHFAKAEDKVAKGVAAGIAALKHFDKAVKEYGKAWKDALKAIGLL